MIGKYHPHGARRYTTRSSFGSAQPFSMRYLLVGDGQGNWIGKQRCPGGHALYRKSG
ncbi:MAG: hypothetical protein R3F24_11770 [Gammaproteobacteria bacterium]